VEYKDASKLLLDLQRFAERNVTNKQENQEELEKTLELLLKQLLGRNPTQVDIGCAQYVGGALHMI
jgi:hypothetical protein